MTVAPDAAYEAANTTRMPALTRAPSATSLDQWPVSSQEKPAATGSSSKPSIPSEAETTLSLK